MKLSTFYFGLLFLIFLQCISIINGDTDYIEITPEQFFEVKNSMNFKDKVALVTGSNSGIGGALVRLFSYLGAKVVVTGRNETRVKEVANDCWKLSPYHIKPLQIALDLSIAGNVGKLVNETIKYYGKINIVVNSAGIGLFASIKDPSFTEVYKQTNLVNEELAVELTQLTISYLEETRGSLVLIASILAGNPIGLTGAYSMAKNALIAFAASVAHDVGPNVRVNVISPGVTDGTRIFRSLEPEVRQILINNTIEASASHRPAVPLDMAKMILFYCSDLASYMTGSNIDVVGGLNIKLL